MYGYMGTQLATTIDNDDNDDDDNNLDGPALPVCLPVCVQLHWCKNLHICIECQAGIYGHVDTYSGIEESFFSRGQLTGVGERLSEPCVHKIYICVRACVRACSLLDPLTHVRYTPTYTNINIHTNIDTHATLGEIGNGFLYDVQVQVLYILHLLSIKIYI